ncbi:exopolysaccharide phosphotransferase cps2G [Vibrio inusitatus NBRC 102082]|uniref:Exopolysaccharide phosphotransferase cps2G n=1 Tax=Vibrio inusitatus NBRC 102082 TaxID=1219070 RepID=A0A4Y3HW85_9VIBR|nr:stealth family protein [Vibrio inusitatus]GEA51317.1 exopolysaccharide phosphotransferase cps2G [Vibrio inusitatus NBRC 102082]
MKVDIVYTWVNDCDALWLDKRKKYLYKTTEEEITNRYDDQDELKYSLRSVAKFAPWINHIYIVTDNQKPNWLKYNSKISIINHEEIIPNKYLPTFNSSVIELFIHRIPNLSENFLYLNDDVLFGRNLNFSDFYKNKTTPYAFTSSILQKHRNGRKNIDYHQESILSARQQVYLTHHKHINFAFRHSAKAYIKSRVEYVFEKYSLYLLSAANDKFRKTPVNIDYLYLYHEIAENRVKTRYIRTLKNKSLLLFNSRTYLYINKKNEELISELDSLKPFMVCMNDVTNSDNINKLFSKTSLHLKSQYEK